VTPRRWLPDRQDLTAAAMTAVLLFVGYAPYDVVAAPFVALVPFLWRLDARTRGGAQAAGGPARLGFWTGLLASALVLYWMIVALWHFTPLAAAGYLATVLVLAAWWAALAWTTGWVRRRTALPLWVVFPLLWTAVEWAIGHQGDIRFPWLGLGTSLTAVPVLVQWAEIAGARGVTLWLAWINVLLYLALRHRRWRPAAVAAATVVGAWGYGLWRERSLVLRPATVVAVVQPNLGFKEKVASRDQDSVVEELLRLTVRADSLPGVRLVAWPEAATDGFFVNHPQWVTWIGDTARATGIPILVGGLDAQFYPNGTYDTYNAAFFFDTTGSDARWPSYRKHYLVPIVERVPFVNPRWFGSLKWFGGFGHGERFPVYPVAAHAGLPGGRFGVLICYESAFEDLARRYRREGADFLLNITNDSWFGRTAAPYQHASHLVMRAIETRMGIARAANTGISEYVDPLGVTHHRTPLDVERVEADTVYTTSGRTPYVRLGDWVGLLALVGTGAVVLAAIIRRGADGVMT
jgi:apolipoprotein N-acyltransferase